MRPPDTDTETGPTARRWAPFLPARLHLTPRQALRRGALALALVGAFGCAHALGARSGPSTLPNLALPTAGGQQVWADTAWDDGWRVQRHAWTGHARLLDDQDVRRAWGSVEACQARLAARRERGQAAPPLRRTVVLLHGLWRTRDAMDGLERAFGDAGFEVVNVAYPSTRDGIASHAAQVAGVLDSLPGAGREVSFVTHSLGGLVLRALLEREDDPWRTRHELGRAVLIAAPNQGSDLASIGARIPGALQVYGRPSREIAAGAAAELGTLPMPFLTVAAGSGGSRGWNPLIDGDDDGVVRVAETRLPGAAGTLLVRGVHTLVMADPTVIDAALDFVDGGELPEGVR